MLVTVCYIRIADRKSGHRTKEKGKFKIPRVEPLELETARSADRLSHCVQNEVQMGIFSTKKTCVDLHIMNEQMNDQI